MEELGPIETVADLLDHPSVRTARTLELSICDAVHFRLIRTDPIFRLTELRLCQRDPQLFAGFTDIRSSIEKSMKGGSIEDKVAACCTRRPEWLEERQILYSTELEVWMDMSYPNPWTLELYHAALMAGKDVYIPRLGPFSATFHTLLKEKNGYELTQPEADEKGMVQVHVGEQSYLKDPYLHLLMPKREIRRHPFDGDDSLASQLAFGILEKDLEDRSAKGLDEDTFRPHSLGYRLIGPTLLLLLQEYAQSQPGVRYTGLGAEFLAELTRSIEGYWPGVSKIADADPEAKSLSIFPESGALSLLPGDGESLIELPFDVPVDLLLPAMGWLMRGSFKGPEADQIQKAAAAFVRDYAQMSRGLVLPLPAAPVIRHWCQLMLAPERDCLRWMATPGRFPGFRASRTPWGLKKGIEDGPWPTGSYLRAGPLSKWLALRSPGRVPDIIESASRYA